MNRTEISPVEIAEAGQMPLRDVCFPSIMHRQVENACVCLFQHHTVACLNRGEEGPLAPSLPHTHAFHFSIENTFSRMVFSVLFRLHTL